MLDKFLEQILLLNGRKYSVVTPPPPPPKKKICKTHPVIKATRYRWSLIGDSVCHYPCFPEFHIYALYCVY